MAQVKHVVILRFKAQTTQEQIAGIFEAIDDLQEKIPGIVDICSGVYDSPEGLNKAFTHAFIVTFADPASRDVYLEHPDHEVVKQMLLAALSGLDDVIAFDFEEGNRFRY
jgi:hypothetical protein